MRVPASTPNEREREVLRDLAWLAKNGFAEGAAPIQFGGTNGSHHGATATRMVGKGWVERRYRGNGWGQKHGLRSRGSCVYRITDAGRAILAALSDGALPRQGKPLDAVPGAGTATEGIPQ